MESAEHAKTNEAWETLWDAVYPDTTAVADELSYYAKYPVELADKLARDIVMLQQGEKPFWFVSPLLNSDEWWRVFKALHPGCPVKTDVFLKLSRGWFKGEVEDLDTGVGFNFDQDGEYQSLLIEVADEVRIFGLWIRASGLWENRPSESESVDRERLGLIARLRDLLGEITRKGQVSPRSLVGTCQEGMRALRVLESFGLYSGYKRGPRRRVKQEIEAIIQKYGLTEADITV